MISRGSVRHHGLHTHDLLPTSHSWSTPLLSSNMVILYSILALTKHDKHFCSKLVYAANNSTIFIL